MTRRPTISRESGAASVFVLAAVALALLSRGGPTTNLATATAERRDFSDTISETGTIGTEQVRLYSSAISGTPVKLLELVPEGSVVRPGDVLARFDVSALASIRDRAHAELDQASAEIDRATAERDVDALRAATDIDAARRQADTAGRALLSQTQGKSLVDAAVADAALHDAARELEAARTAASEMTQLLREGFVTKAEWDRANQALARAEEQQRLAQTKRDALVQFEAPADASRAAADATAAESNVGRTMAAAAARRRQRDADIAMAVSRRDQLRANIAALDAQVGHGELRADAPGMVVYQEQYFGAERRKPQIGDEIVAGQPIIAIPDFSAVTVETSIREVDLHRVSADSRVIVRVDAYPDVSFPARVSFVGALAQRDGDRAGARFFPVTVALMSHDARLRSGMTARVDIETTVLPHALVVPVIAVRGDAIERWVEVVDARGIRSHRPITVVAENSAFAVVTSGLMEGERVLLLAPEPGGARR